MEAEELFSYRWHPYAIDPTIDYSGEPTTLVEFPAYEGRLPEIRRMLDARGFGADSLHVTEMLEEIHSSSQVEPAPPGARYKSRIRRKYANTAVTGAH